MIARDWVSKSIATSFLPSWGRLHPVDAKRWVDWGRSAVSVGRYSLLEIDAQPCGAARRGPELARTLVSVVWRNDSWFVKSP